MIDEIKAILKDLNSKGDIQKGDEDIDDITEAVIAFAEMIVQPPVRSPWRDVVLILSIFDYLTQEAEHRYGLNPVYPKPDDVREYIKNKRKNIIKDVKVKPNKRTGIKAHR